MIYCLNAACPGPANPDSHQFCQSCGERLRLGDRYEALFPIGQGCNSRSFVGRDRHTLTDSQCLIKDFMSAAVPGRDQQATVERFRQQMAQLAIASQHPQIPSLQAYFERNDRPLLVQSFLVGPDLEQQLQEKHGAFESDQVWAFLRNVVPIVQHLHHHRIVHRDIKPTNFRQPPHQAQWWLVDLGASRPLTATHPPPAGTVVGSAEYAAPEQLRGAATFASDLYSLGLVCVHLLTGLRPFDLFDSGQGCWCWRSVAPQVAPALADLLERMIAPRLGDRWASVTDILPLLQLPPLPPQPAPVQSAHQPWPADWSIDLQTAVQDMVVLPQSTTVVLLTTAGTLEVRSQRQPPLAYLTSTAAMPTVLAAHPTEPQWVVGTRQGILQCWQWSGDRGQVIRQVRVGAAITQLAFTADGQTLFLGTAGGQIYRWDWPTGPLQEIGTTPAGTITAIAPSPQGQWLASGNQQGQVSLWQVRTGEYLRTLSQQRGAITALAWLAGAQTLVMASWDITVSWRCPHTGARWQQTVADGFLLPVRSLLAHPTRPQLVTGSQDGQLQCWDPPPQPPGIGSLGAAIAPKLQAASEPGPIVRLCLAAVPGAPPTLLSVTQSGQLAQRSLPA